MKYLLLFFSFLFLNCSDNLTNNLSSNEKSDGFDRSFLLKNYTENIIIPAIEKFKTDVENLESSVNTFSEDKTETNFNEIRNNFINTYKSWQYVEMFDIMLAEEIYYTNKINIYPTDSNLIDTNISGGNYLISNNNNSEARGLPAIDYLLYGVETSQEDTKLFYIQESENSENYIKYIKDVISNIKSNTSVVLEDWKTNKQSFIESSANTSTSSLNKLTNDYIYYIEKKIRSYKIGIPAGKFSEGEKYTGKVEAFYAKNLSKELALAAIDASKDLFEGKHFNSEEKGESFYTYLNYLSTKTDNNNLANDIVSKINNAKTYINNNLADDFSNQVETDNTKMLNAFDELQKVVVVLKIDLLQQFNISVDYVDADGD